MKIILLACAITGLASAGCTCGARQELEPGMVRYESNSDRQTIISTESQPGSNRCAALWAGSTEIKPAGTPYRFHLERIKLRPRRIETCGGFVRRDKSYEFVFDADSTSIREIRPAAGRGTDPRGESNRNLWSAIAAPEHKRAGAAPPIDPTRELNRTAWVLARRKIRGYYVGRVDDAGQNEKLVALKKSRVVEAGQIGQVEAVGENSVIVRFYEGSRAEAFGTARDALRRWYANVGGPYSEVKDDLFTAIRAEILEVNIDDVIEVNDYLDQKKADRT
ncbi:MAG TPA: hypothetical protein VKX39_04345 [Bryobacteraceae bacterium]|jgi:hypothetical protein|nr:hypothetical protein [Bryobacteraceae bacterium]